MATDKNTWKGFFFFLLRLLATAVVAVGLFFAYEYYKAYKTNNKLIILRDALIELQDSLNN